MFLEFKDMYYLTIKEIIVLFFYFISPLAKKHFHFYSDILAHFIYVCPQSFGCCSLLLNLIEFCIELELYGDYYIVILCHIYDTILKALRIIEAS